MFGLTKRERRWKAEQKAVESLASMVDALSQIRIAEANADAAELKRLQAENEKLRIENAELNRILIEHRNKVAVDLDRQKVAASAARIIVCGICGNTSPDRQQSMKGVPK